MTLIQQVLLNKKNEFKSNMVDETSWTIPSGIYGN